MLHLEHFHSKQSVEFMYSTFGICDTINKPQLTVNDLGLSYRTINYWDKNQLLLNKRKNEKGWRKFSFIDFMWINMIQNLREFGFSTKTIHKIKALCTSTIPDDVLETVKSRENLVQPKGWSPTFLTNVLAELVCAKSHISILYDSRGELFVHFLEQHSNVAGHPMPYLNYVCLSLSEIYIKFLQTIDISVIRELKILPDILIRVIAELKECRISSITFLYGEEDVKISQEHYFSDDEFIRDCFRLLITTNFSDYVVTYMNSSESLTYSNTLPQPEKILVGS